jgi:chaperonin GroES
MTTVLHPKGNRITVLRDPPREKSEGGIDLANAVVDDHEIGTVIDVGPGNIYPGPEGPVRVPPDYKVDDRVLYSRFSGAEATIGGKNIRILTEEEIIGVLEGEGE